MYTSNYTVLKICIRFFLSCGGALRSDSLPRWFHSFYICFRPYRSRPFARSLFPRAPFSSTVLGDKSYLRGPRLSHISKYFLPHSRSSPIRPCTLVLGPYIFPGRYKPSVRTKVQNAFSSGTRTLQPVTCATKGLYYNCFL